MDSLVKRLEVYRDSDYYGFHMPGHKRNTELFGEALPYGLDITEIDGFDDLHHSEGYLLEAQNFAAQVFGAEETHFLINGSTVGILSAIHGCTKREDKVIVARNSHKAVYNGVFLNGLKPVYVYPKIEEEFLIQGEITAVQIEEILQREDGIKAILITSPTYDGVVSDVEGIADVAHKYKIPLIVDEAHGAHFGFDKHFPQNSNAQGADVVIHSLHKTLPSLTQTALLHINGTIVDRNRIKEYLKIYQSSSPSYILLASIDKCVRLVDAKKEELFLNYTKLLKQVREELKSLCNLKLVEIRGMDISKIVIFTKGTSISSKELYNRLLKEYHIQMEMVGPNYVLGITSIGDYEKGFERLLEALFEIDQKISEITSNCNPMSDIMLRQLPIPRMAQNENERAGKFYYLYPPGIPFVTPDEVLTDEIKECIKKYEENGFEVRIG